MNSLKPEQVQVNTEKLKSRIEMAELFTNRFGSFNKSDYEVLMFTVYLDSLSKPIHDFEISRDLGITEQKVRNLRVKSQLMYPREINWIEQLSEALKNGSYDDGMITITLEDPSVRNRIRFELESKSKTVNISLNSKQLILPVESFLILAACAEKNPDKVIHALNEKFKKNYDIKDSIQKNKIGKKILNNVNDFGNFLQNLVAIYNVAKPIIEALIELMKNFS